MTCNSCEVRYVNNVECHEAGCHWAEQVEYVSGRAWGILMNGARKWSDLSDKQRDFIAACINQLQTDLKNS